MKHTTCGCGRPHVCACGHHQSIHAYDPADQGRAPPKRCGVSGCACRCYVDGKQAKSEARQARYDAWFENYLAAERAAYAALKSKDN